jgi:hypothetical protein
MTNHPCDGHHPLINRFSLWEKTLWRLCFWGTIVVGLLAMARQSPVAAGLYAVLAVAGLMFAGFPALCRHCPYPSRHSSCLFVPHPLMKAVYPYAGPKMSGFEKVVAVVATAVIVVFPQPWLVREPVWLAAFWALCLPMAIAFPSYYCRRCRHVGCPLNRVPGRVRSELARGTERTLQRRGPRG